jgi:hypothetical protein
LGWTRGGSELAVLEGMREMLRRLRPAVVMEVTTYTRERAGEVAKERGLESGL